MHVQDKDLVGALSQQLSGTALQAAVYARMNTPAGAARWLGPLGNYLIARPAARAAAHNATERTDLPLDAAVVLAIGDGELHVWSADPMLSDVKEHLGSAPLDTVTEMRAQPGKSWWELSIAFGDASLDVQARGDVGGLVAAWESSRAAG